LTQAKSPPPGVVTPLPEKSRTANSSVLGEELPALACRMKANSETGISALLAYSTIQSACG
jgi:hypothetical protein